MRQVVKTCKESTMGSFEVYPSNKRTQLIEVRDKEGNAYICDADALKNPKQVTSKELEFCIDESRVPQPYGGD